MCRTPPDEGSAHRRDLYLTTLVTDRYSCPSQDSGPESQQASNHAPDRATTGIGKIVCSVLKNVYILLN